MAVVTVDGIKVDATQEKFGSTKVLRLIANVQKGELSDIFELFDFVFGEGKFEEVEAKYADEETGLTQMDDVMGWFERVTEKVGAKN